jgi:hypothetical protein
MGGATKKREIISGSPDPEIQNEKDADMWGRKPCPKRCLSRATWSCDLSLDSDARIATHRRTERPPVRRFSLDFSVFHLYTGEEIDCSLTVASGLQNHLLHLEARFSQT